MTTPRGGANRPQGNVNPPGATPPPTGDTVKQQAGEAAQNVKEQAKETAEQAKETAGQAVDQVKQSVMGQASTQKERVSESIGSVAGALREAGKQLREGEQGGFFAQYADQAADRIEGLASHLNEREIGELVADVERYARRQPALFLGGAFILGVLGARYLKSSAQPSSPASSMAYRSGAMSDAGAYRSGGYGGGTDFRVTSRPAAPARTPMPDAGYRESLRGGEMPRQPAAPPRGQTINTGAGQITGPGLNTGAPQTTPVRTPPTGTSAGAGQTTGMGQGTSTVQTPGRGAAANTGQSTGTSQTTGAGQTNAPSSTGSNRGMETK